MGGVDDLGADRASQRVPRRLPDERRRLKAAEAIAQQIVDDISDEQLPAGARLPGEKDMLARFDAGRGTLRESLRFLEMNGAIRLKAGPAGGPIVRRPDGLDFAAILGLFVQSRGLPFKELVTARLTVEPELAAMAATSIAPEQLLELKDSVDGMRAFLDDEQNFLAENDRFHTIVAAAAGNDLLTLLTSSLHEITDGTSLGVSYPMARREGVLRSHEAVYQAIADGDAEGARWTMRQHLQRFQRRIEQDLPEVGDRIVRWRDISP
jgi:DNA-binding FadR family transcriptional regulator